MTDTKLGTFEDLIRSSDEPLQRIAERLRQVILKIDPDACEVIRLGERAAMYGLGPKKMTEGYAYIMPHKGWVNLGFFRGAELDDPDGLLEGTGAKMRHAKVRTLKVADAAAIKRLIRASIAERRAVIGQ